MTVDELFGRCSELALTEPSAAALRFMHETLVLCCAEGLKTVGTGFGSLFSQVDFLTKHSGMTVAERIAIQAVRRRSNHTEVPPREQWLQDVRTLARFISAVFKTSVPDGLTHLIPHSPQTPEHVAPTINRRYLRCIVSTWNEQTIEADTADGAHITIDYTEQAYLNKVLREGMQLNLLDCHVEHDTHIQPGLVVVEPDFLIDISTLARCFQAEYGHHPLLYTIERLKPRANSQAILLGNFAGTALDNIINQADHRISDSISQSFREQALQFCTCEDFNPATFVADAQQQCQNISEAVTALFTEAGYDRSKALLEPSFVCERLGLQGRVDLMTSDMRLLVEQKSGKNYSIERPTANIQHK